MSVTPKQFESLRKFKTVSFANWDSENFCNLKKVHAKLIIVGLNPSKEIKFLENFHKNRFDFWYKKGFSKAPFKNSCMTDFISHHEPNSSVIIEKWKNDNEFRNINIKNLKEQFEILRVKSSTPILCLGQNTEKLFSYVFSDFKHIFVVKHPNSYRMKNNRNVFLADIKKIGKKIERYVR